MATALIRDGKVAVKGLYSQKTGKKYDATVCLDDTGKYVNFRLEFVITSYSIHYTKLYEHILQWLKNSQITISKVVF